MAACLARNLHSWVEVRNAKGLGAQHATSKTGRGTKVLIILQDPAYFCSLSNSSGW
jgi:hypothetical protein